MSGANSNLISAPKINGRFLNIFSAKFFDLIFTETFFFSRAFFCSSSSVVCIEEKTATQALLNFKSIISLFQHAGRNSTICWYWIHGTTTIRPLEFYSKLPFEWLGPFTPQLMKLVRFESPTPSPMGTDVISTFLLL